MRPILLGLVVAVMAVAFGPSVALAATTPAPAAAPKPLEISPDARTQGKKEAPKILAATGLLCEMSDARFIGSTTDPTTKKPTKYYEVACKGAMGYVLVDKGDVKPGWASCLDQAKVNPDGKTNGAACFLPGNLDQDAMLQPFIAKTGVPCDATSVRGVGHSDEAGYFEVACKNGRGYIVKTSTPPDPSKPVSLITCLDFQGDSPVKCALTTPDSQMTFIDRLAATSGKNCTVKDRRYMLTTQDQSNYYEVACQDGKGYVLHEAANGSLTETIDCAVADGIDNGCTLTNARAAESQENDLYSKLSKAAGYDCAVTKYAPLPVNVANTDVVELVCSNRPDGAIALFPVDSSKGGSTKIFNCALSGVGGYRCAFTKPDAAFPKVTADLVKLGKTQCTVSDTKAVGSSDPDKVYYLEVACSDGTPGYMIAYNQGDLTPKQAIVCSFAKDIGSGCTLPTNRPH